MLPLAIVPVCEIVGVVVGAAVVKAVKDTLDK